MKKLFKIFVTIFYFFIPIFASAAGINQFVLTNFQPKTTIQAPALNKTEQIILNNNKHDEFIATSNSRNLEISAIQDRKNSQNFGFSDKSISQSKLFQQYFNTNYNIPKYSISHKISSYLKNEICTRAP